MSTGGLARQRSSSSSSRPQIRTTTPVTPYRQDEEFEPCAATASIFLYAQGSSIICLHHDTLAIDRRFELHKERILFLSVDNVSERGAGRLVVSYDAGQTAIVWDLFTGDEIARFASYEPIRVAAWMKNGNVAFGNSTKDHRKRQRYLNGSILLVSLRPAFTILHTLPVPRAPSPIANLAWHASSTKQKSDMLAIQTLDGDLRVWSIAKPPTAEPPKVIRILKRTDSVDPGPNWIAWSKNGRILQYSEGETWAWDVRTKHVSCEPIPTIEGVRGLANYGPTAALFTLGPNSTIQQYDMNPPAMVKNVQYLPMGPPPVPAKVPGITPQINPHSIPGTAPPVTDSHPTPSRGPVNLSTIQKTTNEMRAIELAQQARSDMSSPVSSRSMTESMSSRSSNPYHYQRTQASYSSRAASGTTFSTISPSMIGRESFFSGGSSVFPQTASMTSAGRRSRGSRLRQEVLLSPESKYVDLFPRTRARLSTVQYKPPQPLDQENATADDLRKQMLDVVFGWEDDIEPLIRDELAHHQPGSTSAVLLAKWLGEVDTDQMAAIISSGNVGSSDWMLLALSSMGGQSSAGKMGQAFVQRLLQQGDFHTSATILLGMGDREDAVEVYVSRSFFMEAILLTCLIFPTDWQRQAHLVRRWGEFVVENSQQQLAIRCFQCTGVEPPMPWASPSLRSQSTASQASQSVISLLSPPISPPPVNKPPVPSRMPSKGPSLKVITSFGPPDKAQFKFPGLKSDDRTPTNAPGITPIAESAISPGGTPGGFLRPHSRSKGFNRAMTPGGHRNRLPSIGETPIEGALPSFPRPSKLPTPNDSGSDMEKERFAGLGTQEQTTEKKDEPEPLLLLSSARYEPSSAVSGKSPMTALPNPSIDNVLLPDPSADAFTAFREREKSKARNASKDRKPDGLHIRMPSNQVAGAFISPAGTGSVNSDSRRSHVYSDLQSNGSLSERLDSRSDARSPPLSSQSWSSAKSPSVSGRSIDQYISSLEEAGYHTRRSKDPSGRRHKSREGREHKSRSKQRIKDHSQDRGRNHQKHIRPAKRSPSSPVPMTPDDLHRYTETPSNESVDSSYASMRSPGMESRHGRDHSQHSKAVSKLRSGSKASEYSNRTVRHISPDGYLDSQLGSEASFAQSKASSRRVSPNGLLDPNGRGRSKSKGDGSMVRSPSSPLPLADQAKFYQRSEDEDERMRLVDANRQRLRSTQRSSSRRAKERGTSARRDPSPDRRRRKQSRNRRSGNEAAREPQSAIEPRMTNDEIFAVGADRFRESYERLQRKEVAARELEARRESLARRPEVPEIPHPSHLYSSRPPIAMRSQTDLSNSPTSWGGNPNMAQQQQQQRLPSTAFNPREFGENRAASVGPYGLPATPKAMRHPRYTTREDIPIPEVPEIPDTLAPLAETYATGQPMMELPRSMSAPIPFNQPPPPPTNLPSHPAFHKALRAGHKNSNFSPLGEIGQHRRRPSMDSHPPVISIDEALHAADSTVQITTIEPPPLLPELQHLYIGNNHDNMPIPPPPPPPPAFPSDPSHHSASSGSGLGVISIAIDDQPGDQHVVEVPPPLHSRTISPPPRTAKSPPPTVVRQGSDHKRGRSDQFKNGIKGFTERLRSTSRGRKDAKNQHEGQVNTPSPYESVPPLYF
ncbi:MAG: hypothetical protein Q9218_004811 [Villophora microphyllina]